MKLFKVKYNGSWLGGRAIVQANSAEEAIELVRNHPETMEFEMVEAEELTIKRNQPAVVFNDNGDY